MSNISEPWRTTSPGLTNKNTQNGEHALQLADWICRLIQIQISAADDWVSPSLDTAFPFITSEQLCESSCQFTLYIHPWSCFIVRAPGGVTHGGGSMKSNRIIRELQKHHRFRKMADVNIASHSTKRMNARVRLLVLHFGYFLKSCPDTPHLLQ